MRAGTWLSWRDLRAARMSWQRARQVADRLPAEDPVRTTMRIAPRALLCVNTFRAGGSIADTGFDELRDLATAADDKVSLAVGMAGQVWALWVHARDRESSQLAAEFTSLIESIGDPTLTVALLSAALTAKFQTGEIAEVLRLAQRIIDLADGDPDKGNLILESPLALATMYRATARACIGNPGWKGDLEQAVAMGRAYAPVGHPAFLVYKYLLGIPNGGLLPDAAALRETAETLEVAEQKGDEYTLACARFARGLVLVQQESPERRDGFDLLAKAREAALQDRFTMAALPPIDIELAKDKARTDDLDGAIELLRAVVDDEFATGEMAYRGAAVTALVESLLQRGTDADAQEAATAVERLAAVPIEPGFVLFELPLLRLRGLLARARGDELAYRDLLERYRAMATSLGFEGHMAIAEAMT
jgi:adenylate cyclase